MKGLQFKLDHENLRASVILRQFECPGPSVYPKGWWHLVFVSHPPSRLSEGLGRLGEAPKQLREEEEEHLLLRWKVTFEEARQTRDTPKGI